MLNGIFSALPVPFDASGHVMEAGLRQVIRHNLDREGVNGLYVNGSTGENFMMAPEQKKEVLRITRDEAGEAVELIAQVGSLDLNESLELAAYAKTLGYKYLSAITPFYYRFTFAEIKAYYDAIANAAELPLLIYALPALTRVEISTDQYDELFANEHIVGVKYSDGNCLTLERLRQRYPDKLIMYGIDEMLIFGLLAGANGAIGSTYNVNGRRARRLFDLIQKNELAPAYQLQHECNDIICKMIELGVYQTVKEVLRQKGIAAGHNKLPMRSFDPARSGEVAELIAKYGL